MSDTSPILRLARYAARHRPRVVAATACSAAKKLFDIAPEILIGMAVDAVVSGGGSVMARLGFADAMSQLEALAVITLAIWIAESIFQYLYSVLWRTLAQDVQHELRMDAFAHALALDVAFFEDRTTGGLVAVLNDDVNQLERFLDGGANALVQLFTSIVLIGGIFFYLAPLVALVAIVPIPAILVGAFRYQRRALPLYQAVREQAGVLAGRLANDIAGIATIKSFTAEAHQIASMREASLAYCRANAGAIRVSSAFIPIIRMAVLAGFVATLLLGGWMVTAGKLAVGSYSVLVFLTQRLLWPFTTLAETVDLYQRAMASTRRILDLVEVPARAVDQGRALPRGSVRGRLAFDAVSFAYPGRAPALDGVTLGIPAGTTTALVGPTGSGKTTLVKLLLRFHEPTAGCVSLDGVPLAELKLADLRACVGLVSQDVFLFDGTVADNIAFGTPGASRADVESAARQAEAHEFIAALPQGYDTVVGERGQKLSGGQRQRLSIARAVLKDPPILVLDEATSAVDNETEAAIQRSLARLAHGRTIVMIAHRLSTIRHADQIVVLEGGRVVERGTSGELVPRGGLYAALWRVQTGQSS